MKKFLIPPVFMGIGLLLILSCFFFLSGYNLITFPYNLSGLILCYFGLVIMGKARDLFRQNKTTLALEKPTTLIREGIFAKTRNPMYIGMFIMLLGVAVCFCNLVALSVPLLFLITVGVFVVPYEERMMIQTFGQEYHNYRQQVKRWI